MSNSSLTYPIETPPDPGEAVSVAAGISWTRSPLPMRLNHINLWLLEDDAGWTVVDTGMNLDDARQCWEKLMDHFFGQKPLTRVIVTHMHPDHSGLAGWLVERNNAEFHMSRTDYLMCRVLAADHVGQPPQDAIDFYHAAGFDDQALELYKKRFGSFGKAVAALPDSYIRLRNGNSLNAGGRNWTLIEGTGHAPEHICLFDEANNVFIAGDQLLPGISPNVSVWPTEPDANPLADWIESCRMLVNLLNPETLVLPSHGRPFLGAPTRLNWLVDHHLTTVEQLQEACGTPRRVVDLIPMIFSRKLDPMNYLMATGEILAHLNYMVSVGDGVRDLDDHGVAWFSRR